jgi:hypothetical protein
MVKDLPPKTHGEEHDPRPIRGAATVHEWWGSARGRGAWDAAMNTSS